jgi:hypothetical protein
MTEITPPLSEFDDLAAAVREGRPLRPARAYRIEVADDTLAFRTIEVADQTPLGRQILEAAGARPIEEFSLLAIMPSGDFEDVRLDEPFDLRGRGAERFIICRTDRAFKFTIDNRQLEWGKPVNQRSCPAEPRGREARLCAVSRGPRRAGPGNWDERPD